MDRIFKKCKALIELNKDEAFSAGPASIASVGYMNPVYSSPIKTKKKKKKYQKIIM
jgi:hypothetical protein